MIQCCDNCNRHIGYIVDADSYCSRCKHYNIIRNGKIVKVVIQEFYTKSKNGILPKVGD